MLQASGLTKYFGGKRAVGPVSFQIDQGRTVGFLGLNGVGKTTLLRMIACDLRPSAGSLVVRGIDGVRDPHGLRRLVGFLPQYPPLYEDMTVGDYLRFAGRIRGMDAPSVERRIPEVEDLTHLRHMHNEIVRHLSHGYRQRVGVAQAVVHDPDLLILDEPTHGLDPAQIVEMRTLIRGLTEYHTVLISSHNLPEISETCDHLFVLDAGEIIASGTEQELSGRLLQSRYVEVSVLPGRDAAAAAGAGGTASDASAASVTGLLSNVPGVKQVSSAGRDDGALAFVIETADDRRADICKALVEAGYGVVRLEQSRRKLENVFLELVQGSEGASDRDHIPS